MIIATVSTSGDHDLYRTKQEKDRHIAQLTRKLQSVTREIEESQKMLINDKEVIEKLTREKEGKL